MSFKLTHIAAGAVLAAGIVFSATAEERTSMDILKEQYNHDREQLEDIFQQKVDMIRERTALPEKMRMILIKQANEMKEFDIYTLDRRMELRVKQMQERDDLKNKLKRELLEKETKAAFPTMLTKGKEEITAEIAPLPQETKPTAEAKPAEPVSKANEQNDVSDGTTLSEKTAAAGRDGQNILSEKTAPAADK